FKHNPEKPQSLNGNSVLPIFEDRKGIVWIGTDKSKLNKFDKSTGKFTYIPIEGYHPYAFFEDNNGIFWVGETTGRLSIFDRTTETYIKSYNGLSSSFITHIAQDSKDHFILWITTHKDGLVKFNINNGEYTHYRHNDKDKYSLSNNSIWGFSQEEDHLWLGTWGGGLNKFDKKGETFTAYKHDPQNPKSISSNVSGNLFITSQGELYISTLGGGLNKFNKQDETFEYYNTSNGLFPSDNLQGILEDKNGNLWIASSTEEIINFNIRTKEFKTYGPGDGIEIGGPWFVANHISPDGQMWFGGPKGVTAFYPENIKNNEFKPPVYITSLTQGGDPLETGKALETLSEIKISWKKPFFEFKAAALNYTRPQHNRYKYKLVGWDSEWFNSGVFRNGRYSNLKGGKYTLRICASNNDGVWCQPDQEVALKIEVSSPFWETAWFKIIVLFLFLMVILFVIVYLQKLRSEIKERKKTKKDLMESEKKYRDLIDSAPDLRYRTDMEGKIIFVSQSVFYLAGYTVEEAIGMKMAEEIYVNPVERTTFLQSLQKNGYITDFEAQLKHKDGTIWWA
ncbi:MAG: PAS domain S-box protein, partial [Desulfobacteraceae bacterium]|nr:PAS domain S-box protein [Desulfobacteraceae bacterium]